MSLTAVRRERAVLGEYFYFLPAILLKNRKKGYGG